MKRILIFLEDLVEDVEFVYPYLRFKEEGFYVVSAAPEIKEYKGKKGMSFKPDVRIKDIEKEEFDCVFVPGGYAPDKLRRDPSVLSIVKGHFEKGKLVCALCHGPWVLVSAGILKGKRVTAFYAIKDDVQNAGALYTANPVEVDGNLITATDPMAMLGMIKEILGRLKGN